MTRRRRHFGRRLFARLLMALVLVLAALYVGTQHSAIAPVDAASRPAFDNAAIETGAGLAAIGNCDICHTAAGGPAYAGGRPIPTPFGTIYSTNITPDRDTGIGGWSEPAFQRAMRTGIARDGTHLYPAFPYDHYTKLTDADIHALYAFLMTRAPERKTAPANELRFPFNLRWTVGAWNLLNLDSTPAPHDPQKDADWNRGAYLVEGLGHCGSCHTPRNEIAAEEKSRAFAGGIGEGWYAPALNQASPAPVPWEADHLFAYLRTGADPAHGAAAGPMAPITGDLSRAAEEDVRAIAFYVASLQGDVPAQRRQDGEVLVDKASRPAAPPAAPSNDLGATLFAGACASCHLGGPMLEPPRGVDLTLSTAIGAPDPTNAIHILLDGIQPPAEQRGPWMPRFGPSFTDAQAAAVLGYLRAQMGRKPAWPDLEQRVRDIRQGKVPS
jgi:mono/diheme cytochrome c family protein